MATSMTAHPTIGSIKASTVKEGVTQFLGIQYATLADRFSPPVLREYEADETIDATRLGPQVLSVSPNADLEFGIIQHSLEYDRAAFSQSGTDGLSLNITIPSTSPGKIESNTKLPVFVFVHGGGFMVGSGIYPQYDMTKFVRLSMEIGMPIIGVTLNYRLGAPGFLTSSAMREKGYKPNNGLNDQRTAFHWLSKHISGFGGDPRNLTVAGESAGGVSVCCHLLSEQPLFKRVMSMSGTMLLMPPIPSHEADDNYKSALKSLGLAEDIAIQQLLKMDDKALLGGFMKSGTPMVPVYDGEIFREKFDFASIQNDKMSIPAQNWCEAAIIGDCQFDGSIMSLRLMARTKGIAAAFCDSITKSLEQRSGLAERLLSAYKVQLDLDDKTALVRILQFVNDLFFYLPSLTLAANLSQHLKTYTYRFNEPNPWDGPWKEHATHALDIVFLLQNFNDFLDHGQKSTAVQFAKDVVAFAHGKDPWKGGKESTKVFGPQGNIEVVEDVPGKTGRRKAVLDLVGQVGADVLFAALEVFMKGPPPV